MRLNSSGQRSGGRRRPARGTNVLLSLVVVVALLAAAAGCAPSGAIMNFRWEPLRHSIVSLKARALYSLGYFQEAEKDFQRALEISGRLQSSLARRDSLLWLGRVSWNLGRMPESRQYFSEALHSSGGRPNDDSESLCRDILGIIDLYDLGKNARLSGRNRESIECFEKAIRLCREKGLSHFELKCLRQEGLTYWTMSDHENFFACNDRGLGIARRTRHRMEEARCLNNIGVYFQQRSEFSDAFRNFEEAARISSGEADLRTEAECLSNMGVVYWHLDNFRQAESLCRRALEIDTRLANVENILMDQNNLGVLYLKKAQVLRHSGSLDIALDRFRECLKLMEKAEGDRTRIQVTNNLAMVHFLRREFDQARGLYEKCLAAAEGIGYSEAVENVLLNLGNLNLEQREYSRAAGYYSRLLGQAQDQRFRDLRWEASYGLGKCYDALGLPDRALAAYERSMEAIEGVRGKIYVDPYKLGYIRNKGAVYRGALGALHFLNSASPSEALRERMFSVIERAKSQAFLEGLADARTRIGYSRDPEVNRKEQSISRRITGAFTRLQEAGNEAGSRRRIEEEIEIQEEAYLRLLMNARSGGEPDPRANESGIGRISDVQKRILDGRTALLEYFLGDSFSLLMFITRAGVELFPLPGKDRIEASLRAYIKSLASPSTAVQDGFLAGERIWTQLLFPLDRAAAKGIGKLIIVPDGMLTYLPFEALLRNDGGNRTYAVQRYEISYAPSASALLLLLDERGRRAPRKSLLAVCQPWMERAGARAAVPRWGKDILEQHYLQAGFDFADLPFSREEVGRISRYFPPQDRDVLYGNGADERGLKGMALDAYRVIHFACHGFLDEVFPLRSALVLGGDGASIEDGFLQAREIYGLELNADLVVLSACQTGKGSQENSEGVVGLSRAFFHAGSKAVVSSLWPVDDNSTATLMNHFYSFLVRGEDKANALRRAKMTMLETGRSHPFFWAGFILSGNPLPITWN